MLEVPSGSVARMGKQNDQELGTRVVPFFANNQTAASGHVDVLRLLLRAFVVGPQADSRLGGLLSIRLLEELLSSTRETVSMNVELSFAATRELNVGQLTCACAACPACVRPASSPCRTTWHTRCSNAFPDPAGPRAPWCP